MYAIYVYTYIAYMYIVYTYIQYIQERQAHDEIAAVAMERVAEELKVIYYLSTSHTFFLWSFFLLLYLDRLSSLYPSPPSLTPDIPRH